VGTSLEVADKAEALSLDDTDTQTDVSNERITANSAPALPIAMRWQNISKGKSTSANALSLEIENISELDLSVSLDFHGTGISVMKRSKNAGTRQLAAGETVTVAVPANELPIQVTNSVAQGLMSVTVTYQPENSAETVSVTYMSSSINYQHEPGYNKVKVFEDDVFMKEYKGKLFDNSSALLNPQEVVGRVRENNGIIRAVTMLDEELSKKNKKGEIVEIQGGTTVSSISIDDLPEVTQ